MDSRLLGDELLDGVADALLASLEDVQCAHRPRRRDDGDLLTVGLHDVKVAVQVDAHQRVGCLDEVLRLFGAPRVRVQALLEQLQHDT